MLTIGSCKLHSNLILAPMAGISDLPFRMLNRGFGCELAFVEMINVRSLGFRSKKTQQLLATAKGDTPLGIQLLAGEEKYLRRAIEILAEYPDFAVVDFNAACPARKVTRRHEGASLLRDPKLLARLLRILVSGVRQPVTVKIRAGWDRATKHAPDIAKYCEDAGVSGISIHGRTKMEEYSGAVDYGVIRAVKRAVNIPVIASGDILSGPLAKRMFDETGCDGVLVARGAFGNPWIFDEILYFCERGERRPRPDVDTIVDTMEKHFASCVAFYGPRVSVTIFRKFFAWYTKGFRDIRALREKTNRIKKSEDMLSIIEGCRKCSIVLAG